MTKEQLDKFERDCRDEHLELIRLARLGIWAEEHGIPLLKQAQERLEHGMEVNRSDNRVTATSLQIREALYRIDA